MPSPTPELKPSVTSRFGGYDVTWPAPACLSIAVRRVHVHTAGRVTGELEISRNNGSGSKILLPSSEFNFSASRTRSSLAKDMTDRCSDIGVDWLTVIEKLANDVQQRARTGEDTVEVLADSDYSPPVRLLSPIIFEGVSNVIFGEKGVAKSTLADYCAICLALPWHDNPLGFVTPFSPVRSLVLDWETNEVLFRHYMACLRRGHNLGATPGIFYRHCRHSLADDLEAIQQAIEVSKAQVVIIDSLGAAAREKEGLSSAESALRFNEALRELSITTLIIGQTAKALDGKKTIYGSTFFSYYSRNIFELCRPSEDDSMLNSQHLALFNRESNLARRSPSIGFIVNYETNEDGSNVSISFSTEQILASRFEGKVSTSFRILELLKNGAMSTVELVQALAIKRNTVDKTTERLRRDSRILKLDNGKWGLVDSKLRIF